MSECRRVKALSHHAVHTLTGVERVLPCYASEERHQ
jgi:hypothetical protein